MIKRPIVKNEDGIDMVPIHFGDLDVLVGAICHVMDLNSDKEYRDHVKSELKMRCRSWLQDIYEEQDYYTSKKDK